MRERSKTYVQNCHEHLFLVLHLGVALKTSEVQGY